MKSWGKLFAGVLLTASVLSGCGDSSTAGSTASPSPEATEAAKASEAAAVTPTPAAEWPRTYTDGLGKEAVIEKQPEKVAVLHFGYTEYLLALGITPLAAAQLSVVESFGTLKEFPQMAEIIDVGEVMSPNLEKLVELQPDLIIAGTGIHDNAYDSLSKISTVAFKNNYGTWKETLNDYAQLLGREEQAEALIEETEGIIAETRDKLAGFKDKTFVFLRPSSKDGFGVVGSKIYAHYHDEKDGFGLKTPENYPENYETISLEALSEMNPDFIFFQDSEETSRELVDSLASNAVWQGISAVRNGHVDYLDISLNTGSPLAIQLAAKQLAASLVE